MLARPQPPPPRIARRAGGPGVAPKAMRTHVGIDFGTSGARATVIDGETSRSAGVRGGAPTPTPTPTPRPPPRNKPSTSP
jgi:hypothetical protein